MVKGVFWSGDLEAAHHMFSFFSRSVGFEALGKSTTMNMAPATVNLKNLHCTKKSGVSEINCKITF